VKTVPEVKELFKGVKFFEFLQVLYFSFLFSKPLDSLSRGGVDFGTFFYGPSKHLERRQSNKGILGLLADFTKR
jgi:hypothetical protein